jgi:hypothetical protein
MACHWRTPEKSPTSTMHCVLLDAVHEIYKPLLYASVRITHTHIKDIVHIDRPIP